MIHSVPSPAFARGLKGAGPFQTAELVDDKRHKNIRGDDPSGEASGADLVQEHEAATTANAPTMPPRGAHHGIS